MGPSICITIFTSSSLRAFTSGRREAGLKPHFVKAEPPSDADIAEILQKISRRVIRKLRRLGYLESGIDATVTIGYDPLLDTAVRAEILRRTVKEVQAQNADLTAEEAMALANEAVAWARAAAGERIRPYRDPGLVARTSLCAS